MVTAQLFLVFSNWDTHAFIIPKEWSYFSSGMDDGIQLLLVQFHSPPHRNFYWVPSLVWALPCEFSGAQSSPLPWLSWTCYSGYCSVVITLLLLFHLLLFLSLRIFAFKKSFTVIVMGLLGGCVGRDSKCMCLSVLFVSKSTVCGKSLEEPLNGNRGRLAGGVWQGYGAHQPACLEPVSP